jgi:hypothetical protein
MTQAGLNVLADISISGGMLLTLLKARSKGDTVFVHLFSPFYPDTDLIVWDYENQNPDIGQTLDQIGIRYHALAHRGNHLGYRYAFGLCRSILLKFERFERWLISCLGRCR